MFFMATLVGSRSPATSQASSKSQLNRSPFFPVWGSIHDGPQSDLKAGASI